MSILTSKLPVSVEINGREYLLNTDFRVGLKIMEAWEDSELTEREKQWVMLKLLYPEIPEDVAEACRLALNFLNCGEESTEGSTEAEQRRYSFSKDAKYIYTAILQTHGVDLERVDYLHWWKFQYLFLDLREDCFFSRLIYYRTQRAKGKLTKEEAEYCQAIQGILDLPEDKNPNADEAADEFMRLLRGENIGV